MLLSDQGPFATESTSYAHPTRHRPRSSSGWATNRELGCSAPDCAVLAIQPRGDTPFGDVMVQ
jgi:hypothetical protein